MNGKDPAFPNTHIENRSSALQQGREPVEIFEPGITKREWFASVALIARHLVPNSRLPEDYVKEAYEMADLMLNPSLKE